ncbi:MAG: hypothetical protein A2052_03695 [Deltaproteobacteria bacterium GWA2_54_12]|nr:MAG: hypothetical protein A2052_03695 [Deltaproteobacteria bacterium GWA2_54_12]
MRYSMQEIFFFHVHFVHFLARPGKNTLKASYIELNRTFKLSPCNIKILFCIIFFEAVGYYLSSDFKDSTVAKLLQTGRE